MSSTSDSDDNINTNASKLKSRRRNKMKVYILQSEDDEEEPGTSSRKRPANQSKEDAYQKTRKRTRQSLYRPLLSDNDESSDEELERDDDGSSDEELESIHSSSDGDVQLKTPSQPTQKSISRKTNKKDNKRNDEGSTDENTNEGDYLPEMFHQPHQKRKNLFPSPLSVMTNEENTPDYYHSVHSKDEFEDAQSNKKKSTPITKTYPRYMYNELIPHLKNLSKEKKNNCKVFLEWKLIYVHDMGEHRDSWRDCPCGKKGIRFLFHILNKCTRRKIFVGSKCIRQFDKSVNTIAQISQKMLRKSINALLIDKNTDGTARFKISPKLALIKKQDEFIQNFNSIPVQKEGTNEYVLTAHLTNNVNMQAGQDYKIWVKLQTNETDDLTAEVVNCIHMKQKTQTPKDVRNFLL